MSTLERSAASPVPAPQVRYLGTGPLRSDVLAPTESLAEGLHRITTEQFSIAIDAIDERSLDIDDALPRAIGALERIVAVLVLVRSAIGDDAYRGERAVVDEALGLLRSLGGGRRELDALDLVRRRFARVLEPSALADLADQLDRRRQLHRLQAIAEGRTLDHLLHRIRRSRARFAAWPVDENGSDERQPIPDGFESIADGFSRTYRRSRRGWRRAGREGFEPRRWSGHVVCLTHQLTLVGDTWPEVLDATARSAATLADALHEAEGLDVLAELLTHDAGLELHADERALLVALVDHGRRELAGVVDVLGGRLLSETTPRFVERMQTYWQVGRSGVDRSRSD